MKFKKCFLFILFFTLLFLLVPLAKANPIPPPNSKTVINFIVNLAVIYFIAATVEYVIIYLRFRVTAFKNDIVPYKLYTTILFINLITFLPTQIYAWFFFISLSSFYFIFIIIAEVLVIFFESVLLTDKIKKWISKYLASERETKMLIIKIVITANFVSFWIGFLQFGL